MNDCRKEVAPPAELPEKENQETGVLSAFGGSPSDVWNKNITDQVLDSLWTHKNTPKEYAQQVSAALMALKGISPRDELEGMMAAQMVAAHNAAMECHRRAMLPGQGFEARREALNQANKLSRTWVKLLEALNRHRGKGQQKVTVEHVHVYAGGQAVVGAVEARGGGGHAEPEE